MGTYVVSDELSAAGRKVITKPAIPGEQPKVFACCRPGNTPREDLIGGCCREQAARARGLLFTGNC
ncbi:MAG: hypothetical protein JXJ04_26390 [Spirochaetales bacterium]|nr:hypothetical protein [Spirochaetales bacterium]